MLSQLNGQHIWHTFIPSTALKASFEYETEKRKWTVKTVLVGLRALIGTPELAETIRFNYTSAKASLEALTDG
jgi:hypothetical protein